MMKLVKPIRSQNVYEVQEYIIAPRETPHNIYMRVYIIDIANITPVL